MTDKIFNFLINYFSNIDDRGVDEMNNFRGDITSDEIVEWLKNIQNTSSEQPSEDLEEAADYYLDNTPTAELMYGSYEGPDVYNAFVAGANWQKEQLINRACTWILNNFRNSGYGCPLYYNGVNYAPNYIVKDFKKAMEDK